MKNRYRKYLMVFDQDKSWGFYINNLGRTVIAKNTKYPSTDHPDNYFFTWEKGRVLEEFHLVFITHGEGIFETKETGPLKVMDGDVFLLFPGVWHRYKPKKKAGWTEHWIGFSGHIAHHFLANGFFSATQPLISKCNKSEVLRYFNTLFKLFEEENFGFQRVASGICIQLMAELYSVKTAGNTIKNLNTSIALAKRLMYERIYNWIDIKQIAAELGSSYSKFRVDFKKQTGTSPLQYFLALKIEKAKEILLKSNKTQKEIAFLLGFESEHYFNRLFKQKTGITPKQFRKANKANT